MFLFFLFFFTSYFAVNYYIFIRGFQAISGYPALKPIYISLFILFSLSFLITRFFEKFLPVFLYDLLLWIGSLWFAVILYSVLSLIIIDLIRLIDFKFSILPSIVKNNYHQAKLFTLLFVIFFNIIVIIYGYYNSRNLQVTELNINLPKGEGKLDQLRAVFLSDTHISPINNEKFLINVIEKINSLNPDIVLMAGDVIDDKAEILRERNIGGSFLNIKSKYGVFMCNGNHEFIIGIETAVPFLEEKGIYVVRDSAVLVAESFYVIGREDKAKVNFTGIERKELREIVNNFEQGYSKILLDHTPINLEKAVENNINLQLSGHTHHGQMFPINYITSMIYEVSWGYLLKNNTHVFVTSGAGTWGPPVRTGSIAEIVLLNIKFI